MVGYTLFQVPGGMLADRFGPRRVLGCAMATWGIFTFLSGMIGEISLLTGLSVLNALIALRFLFGIFQAPIFPTSTRTVTNWFPLSERARANGLALSGVSIGSFLVPPLVSWMILRWSWQSSFYIALGVFTAPYRCLGALRTGLPIATSGRECGLSWMRSRQTPRCIPN